jgi:hypothetical protein
MQRTHMLWLVAVVALPRPAHAQRGGPGFLFQEPTATFGLRLGYDHALAGSDLFDFTTNNLTVDRNDFSSSAWAADLGFRLSSTTDLVLGVAASGSSMGSEFRSWVDNANQPITQRTTFRRVPLTAMFRHYLAPRGRSVGRFAWLPARYAPWVSAGAGVVWYKFRQSGDFVDFTTLRVFSDAYNSTGWAPTALVAGGLDVAVSPHVALTGELRYGWAKARLSDDFSGFHRLDLSGLSGLAGLSWRL